MTDDLVAFLRAQLDADEAAARNVYTQAPWRTGTTHQGWPSVEGDGWTVVSTPYEADAAHIARWDPQRVLGEVAAKRRILDAWQAVYDDIQEPYTGDQRMGEGFGLDHAVQCLATAYADHPDFREEWKP